MTEKEKAEKYMGLLHAMQSGIAQMIANGDNFANPKHLRVGVDSTKVEMGALVGLLFKKGIFTEEEYTDALIEGFEREVKMLEKELSVMMKVNITLG